MVATINHLLLGLTLLVAVLLAIPRTRPLVVKVAPFAALGMIVVGLWIALSWAPPEREMGEVQRLMYVHVPAVWMAMLGFTLNLFCVVRYLFKASWKTDALAESAAAVGLLFGAVGVLLGSIWGRKTWGVWWTWDPRLTTAAILLVIYTGYLALRRFIEDPERRAVWSSVVGIIAYADIPLVWFSVQWRSLHQVQSSPKTMDPEMTLGLRWWAIAFLFVLIAFIAQRYRIALAERHAEVALPDALPPLNPPEASPGKQSPNAKEVAS